MIYKQLESTYKDDVLAEAMYAREVEFFHYDFDRRNFISILSQMESGPEKKALESRLNETIDQMAAVDNIYKALEEQIADENAHEAAILRTALKRKDASKQIKQV